MIIPLPITSEMISRAKELSDEMGQLNNSITSGAGNLAGFIGEELVLQYLQGADRSNTYDYDIKYGGFTLDVKTKRTTVPPYPHYECSVAELNTKQRADMYVFCRVLISHDGAIGNTGYILGFMPKGEYYRRAKHLRKGEIDPDNNFTVKSDCYNVPIQNLWCLSGLIH